MLQKSREIVIVAGGGGTRLWPLSTKHRPKHFLALPRDKSLLRQAFERARGFVDVDRIWLITTVSQKQDVQEALPELLPERLICEPFGKNSGPAMAFATSWIEAVRGYPVCILMMPADHYIPNHKEFVKQVNQGFICAEKGAELITFGLPPKEPKEDFGYIELGKKKGRGSVYQIRRFIEKPSRSRAKRMMESGKFLWNSGIFIWRSDFFQSELLIHAPKIARPIQQFFRSRSQLSKDLKGLYEKFPNISIDYALMERSKCVLVVKVGFDWSDLGNWESVYRSRARHSRENVFFSLGDSVESEGNLVVNADKPVFLFGVKDLVLVETSEAIFLTSRNRASQMKEFLRKVRVKWNHLF